MVQIVRHDERVPEGALIGDYVVRRALGAGGCAAVYVAEHRRTTAGAALKIMHRAFAVSPKMLARFAREVDVIRLVSHPGVVKIDALGQLPDLRPYYAMELLQGATLGTLLRERGRLSPAEALEIMEPLCAALDAVHRAGVVHRDVNGANVFVCEGGARRVVKVIDFGIAKLLWSEPGAAPLTTAGRRLGTPSTMAPEQILGLDVDCRADVYSLGVLLFRMLTGRPPFQGASVLDVEAAHLQTPPPRPSQLAPCDRALDAVVLHCLEKHPDDRYQDALALLDDLRRAVGATGAREASAAPAEGARAIAIHVDVRAPNGDGADDDALLDAVGALLDDAEQALGDAGFALAVQTGNALLGVRLVPADADGARREQERARALAGAIHDALAARPDTDARVRWLVCAHVDAAIPGAGAVAGGPILRLAAWVPAGDTGALVTRELCDGLGETGPPDRHVRIRPAM
ncbi:MAG: serine/threonine-protein kinase [Minicystis sp.]